jgi:hypothetical protein
MGKLDFFGDAVRKLAGADELAELAVRHPQYADAIRMLGEGQRLPPSDQLITVLPDQSWTVTDQLGGKAYGTFEQAVGPHPIEPPYWEPYRNPARNKVARIIRMDAVPGELKFTPAEDLFKRRGFLSGLLDTLEQQDASRLAIHLQSQDTQQAMRKLMDAGRVHPIGRGPWEEPKYPRLFNLQPPR